MPPRFLLLLAVLCPGSTLQLWDTWGDGAKGAPGLLLSRERRQADDENYDDYSPEATDPSETLEPAATIEPLTTMGMLGPRASVGPQSPKPNATEAATRGSAGLDTGGATVERLNTELVTQWGPATVDVTRELTSVISSTMEATFTEAQSVEPATTEVLSTGPVATEEETIRPAVTEAETTRPEVTEAETTRPAVTEAETTRPEVTEAETTRPEVTEAETTRPAVTEAETTQPTSTELLPREPKVTEALFTEPAATVTTKSQSKETNDSINFLESSVTHKDATMMTVNLSDISIKNKHIVTLGSSMTTGSTGTSDRIPVRQCLLVILILALLATIFLVCTVVLAVRLSRKSHMYPVRNYSPTEMVCISSLLPDGGEEAPVVANGGLPKSQGLKADPNEEQDGDDLTLHSFLP